MRWFHSGVLLMVAWAMTAAAPREAVAQQTASRRFEPGQLIIGYKTEEDREAAAKKLKQQKMRVRGIDAPGVRVEEVGSTELLIQIDIPRGATRGVAPDASTELTVLQEAAKALKEGDASVEYAHPNWIQGVNPPQVQDMPGVKLQSSPIGPNAVPQGGVPNDPFFVQGYLWHYQATPTGMNAVGAWQALKTWNKGPNEKPVVVAVLDTGILYDHEDIATSENVLEGYDFVTKEGRKRGAWDRDQCDNPVWHGTHVAGTVGAVGSNNGVGIAGVAWNVKILPLRVLGQCGSGNLVDSSDAIRWAAGYQIKGLPLNENKADIISMSLGGDYGCTPTELRAISDARKAGSVVVVSAGNGAYRDPSGERCDCERTSNGTCANSQCKRMPVNLETASPAGCPGVISVGATDKFGRISYYSNFGNLSVMAPGGDTSILYNEKGTEVADPVRYCPGRTCYRSGGVLSTTKDSYTWLQGTSQAAPHVSGALALALSAHPEWRGKPDLIEQKLRESIVKAPKNACPENRSCGPGLLDAGQLVGKKS